jgi:hypothetical protein
MKLVIFERWLPTKVYLKNKTQLTVKPYHNNL